MDRPSHEDGQGGCHEQQRGRRVPEGEAGVHRLAVGAGGEPTGVERRTQNEHNGKEQGGQELNQVPGIGAPVAQAAGRHGGGGRGQGGAEPAGPWQHVGQALIPRVGVRAIGCVGPRPGVRRPRRGHHLAHHALPQWQQDHGEDPRSDRQRQCRQHGTGGHETRGREGPPEGAQPHDLGQGPELLKKAGGIVPEDPGDEIRCLRHHQEEDEGDDRRRLTPTARGGDACGCHDDPGQQDAGGQGGRSAQQRQERRRELARQQPGENRDEADGSRDATGDPQGAGGHQAERQPSGRSGPGRHGAGIQGGVDPGDE